MPPSLITLAVGDFAELPAVPAGGDAMYMTARGEELQVLLVRGLAKARAASRVVRLSELQDPREADVVLTPRIRKPVRFSCEGLADGWWASGGLWLVTWIGGLAVEDSTYQSELAVECTMQFPRSSRSLERTATSSTVDVSFLERNDFFSWPTLQSLVLPPFLTSDQADSTRAALTARAVDDVAIDLARELKSNFEAAAYERDFCKVAITSPANGSAVSSDAVVVSGTVTPGEELKNVRVSLNGGPLRVVPFQPERQADTSYHYTFRCDVTGLRQGSNWIRFVITAGEEYTRTLVVNRTGQP